MSTTVIDALLVTLGLDASNFTKNAESVKNAQKKLTDSAGASSKEIEQLEKKLAAAQAARAKELEARSKQIAQGLSKIRNEALALFAAFTGATGLKNFVETTIKTAAGLDRMSGNLGMSAKDLASWQLANKNAGGTVEEMTETIKQANAELAKFHTSSGSDSITNLLKWSAISGKSVDLKDLKTGTDVLMASAKVLQTLYKKDPAKAMLAASEIGVSSAFNLLKQGPEGVKKQREEMKSLAEELANASKPAEELRKKMDDLGNSFNSSAVKILSRFIPAMETVTDTMKNIAGFLNDEEAMDGISEKIAKVLAFFGNKDAKEALEANAKKAATQANKPARSNVASPRGMRNNNPGNIEYGAFARKYGATGSDGRFAIFPTMEAGQAAMQALLGGYLSSGTNTVRKAISKWAPSSENNTSAYVDAVSRRMGVSPDQPLTKAHLPALADAISRHENGSVWDKRNAISAVNMPVGAAASARAANGGSSTSTTDIKVGAINVQTQATDAVGIAKSIGGAVSKYGFVAQANTGLA